jgi:hypothetical protein
MKGEQPRGAETPVAGAPHFPGAPSRMTEHIPRAQRRFVVEGYAPPRVEREAVSEPDQYEPPTGWTTQQGAPGADRGKVRVGFSLDLLAAVLGFPELEIISIDPAPPNQGYVVIHIEGRGLSDGDCVPLYDKDPYGNPEFAGFREVT